MNKYWWSLKGRWSLSAQIDVNLRKWGIGLHVQGHGPGVDRDAPFFAEVLLTLGPLFITVQADFLTDEQARFMHSLDE